MGTGAHYPHMPIIPICLNFFAFSTLQLILNDRAINLQSDLTEVVNLDNAAHSCLLNPCYNLASCQPRKERYDCDCPLGFVGRHCQKGTQGAWLKGLP